MITNKIADMHVKTDIPSKIASQYNISYQTKSEYTVNLKIQSSTFKKLSFHFKMINFRFKEMMHTYANSVKYKNNMIYFKKLKKKL